MAGCVAPTQRSSRPWRGSRSLTVMWPDATAEETDHDLGNYHRPLAHRLLSEGVDLRLISSLALARSSAPGFAETSLKPY